MRKFVGFTGGHPDSLHDPLFIASMLKELQFLNAQAMVPAGETKAILSGALITIAGGTLTITEGYAWIEGEIYRIPSKTLSPITNITQVSFHLVDQEISDLDFPETTVIYEDSTPRAIYKEVILDLQNNTSGSSLPPDFFRCDGHAKPGDTKVVSFPNGDLGNFFTGAGLGIGRYVGWALCNGSYGTPDMRGRQVVCLNYPAANITDVATASELIVMQATGGTKTHTLSVAEMPQHNHSSPNGRGFISPTGDPTLESPGSVRVQYDVETTDAGGSQAHNNRDPYRVLAQIMKIKNEFVSA
jgi:microcystin-dependent protein